MGIKYPVGLGTILICDYDRGGFQPPEMVKRRPAIVISPRLPFRDRLCAVVPISGDANANPTDYEVRLEFKPPLPHPFVYEVAWAKCDMLATVSFERLDFFHTARDQYGRRKYLHPKLPAEDLARVRRGILCAIGVVTGPDLQVTWVT
jgi:mRNA interferase MazF